MDDEDLLDLGCHVLPWISNQVILLGQQTRNNAYGTLGCELFVLSQQLSFLSDVMTTRRNLLTVLKIVGKACSRSRNEADHIRALQKIRSYKDSVGKIRQNVIEETQENLAHFVLGNPEYHALLRLIADCMTPDEGEPLDVDNKEEDYAGYSGSLNEALYTQLFTYTTCQCGTGHLDRARLRLSADSQHDDGFSFELVFERNPSVHVPPRHSQTCVQWKEASVMVPRRAAIRKRKKVGFTSPTVESVSPRRSRSRSAQRTRRLRFGEFCTLIHSTIRTPLRLCIESNELKVVESCNSEPCRGIFPSRGHSLGQWLEEMPHLSTKGKCHLAYTIAKSVWQYYDSAWMMAPWTHESIQILIEGTDLACQGRPHPYLTTKLVRAVNRPGDVYKANDIMHQYPNILALGILLIEIAAKQPLNKAEFPMSLSEAVVNDYYTWAWSTAQACNLKETVHSIYEEAVNNCLNADIFGCISIRSSSAIDEIRARQNVLYERIVFPLKRLSDAYRDDWDIPTAPKTNTAQIVSYQSIEETITFLPGVRQADFTIAVFCAFPLEVDAVSALFDQIYEDLALYQNAPGDPNTYTLGQMGHHHVVLVHLPGMGKSVASQAASSIRSTYPNIKLALVVGICGGIPFKKGHGEIILGDIVISEGIVQHDFGRRVPGTFLRKTSITDGPGRPDVKRRGFLSKIMTAMAQRRIAAKIGQNLKAINQTLGNDRAQYPGIEQDELFESRYRHKHHISTGCSRCAAPTDNLCDEVFDLSCQQLGCNKDALVQRKRLQAAISSGDPPSPVIHLGLIASGDTVMKSGQDRDDVATRDSVIAFEMEGVGVWDSLPCLVVKGVCDYADSHKNKIWQPYAAATGAACMRALLDEWT